MNVPPMYKELPLPIQTAKTIILEPSLKPIYPEENVNELYIRDALLRFAEEDELQRYLSLYSYDDDDDDDDDDPTEREHVRNKTPVLGSENIMVRIDRDCGFFSTILEAYNNHWSVRTSPEDWWFTIIKRIAVAVDKNSKSEVVRDFFVSHKEKKILKVSVSTNLYGIDYSWFLNQMTSLIVDNINVPGYVDLMSSNFSTSNKTHKIVSEVTIMSSLQEYFEYRVMMGCGIPSLKMEGNEDDWNLLRTKCLQLKDMLQPIHNDIGLGMEWWQDIEHICDQLINAFHGKPDTKWWSHIFSFEQGWASRDPPSKYDGWFVSKLLGLGTITDLSRMGSSVVTVPMKITDALQNITEDSAFVAGIAGCKMFKEEESLWPSVKAVHGWALLLEPDSKFRNDLTNWERELEKGA